MRAQKRFNWEYLNLYKEIPLFIFLILFRRRARQTSSATLIVIVSLVGEFVAALPAVRDYIEHHPHEEIDLLVSPPLREMASYVRGVRQVYTCRSVYKRASEGVGEHQPMGPYGKALVLRISPECCRLLRKTPILHLQTALSHYSRFVMHLWKSLIRRKRPQQFRELNFSMLGGVEKKYSFEQLFNVLPEDSARVHSLSVMQDSRKKLIIHTGSNWAMKSWPNERWIELLQKVQSHDDVQIIFIGTEADDGANFAAISSRLPRPVASLIGKTTLWETLLVMRESNYFIGVDSGPANMAYATGLRSVVIFGPGPHFYLPPDPRDIALDKSRGRGLLQMFVRCKHGFIHQISADEAYLAFQRQNGILR